MNAILVLPFLLAAAGPRLHTVPTLTGAAVTAPDGTRVFVNSGGTTFLLEAPVSLPAGCASGVTLRHVRARLTLVDGHREGAATGSPPA